MIRVITTIFLFVCASVLAQGKYEDGMKKAFDLWGKGQNDQAMAMFERIAGAEKNQWLPNYYVALMNTTQAFNVLQDKEKLNALLTKAQTAQDAAMAIAPNEPELMVLQALIYTAYVASDPMTNGMKLSGKVNELYTKAKTIDPKNPRAVFGQAEYNIGGARYFGQDTKPMCDEINRSVELFATYKAPTEFHPKWGIERAKEAQAECNKK